MLLLHIYKSACGRTACLTRYERHGNATAPKAYEAVTQHDRERIHVLQLGQVCECAGSHVHLLYNLAFPCCVLSSLHYVNWTTHNMEKLDNA